MSEGFAIPRRVLLAGLAAAGAGCATNTLAGAAAAPSLGPDLAPLSRFIGRWRGTGEGQPGRSMVERSYTPTLGGRFIEVRNRSVYAPQPANPKGETHYDLGYVSFDRGRKRFVLRQFNVEGFVNQYASAGFEGDRLVMDSEGIENIGAGWRARETYMFSGANAFEEVFELAEPGGQFELYSRNKLMWA